MTTRLSAHDPYPGAIPAGRVRPRDLPARRHRPRRRIDDRFRHLHCVGRHPAAGPFPGPAAHRVALSGVVTLLGALSYGELAAMYPKAGGNYVYLREGISPLFGYLYGWTLFVVIQTGTIAAVAVAFARFTSVLFPALTPDVFLGTTLHFPAPIGDIAVGLSAQRIFAIASIVLLTWINVRGVRTAAFIQTTLTAIKTAALAGLILLRLTVWRNAAAVAANFGDHFCPAGGIIVALW